MSDAYRESIIDEVLRICNGLKTYTPGPNEFLSDVPELKSENIEKADRKKRTIIGIIAIGILIAIGIYIWVTHAPTDVPEIELPIQQ